jgi:hypothetical protein
MSQMGLGCAKTPLAAALMPRGFGLVAVGSHFSLVWMRF